ncbi:ABC transporter permease [Chelativorans alearense]|uniref:ABC transporter permease n=1 Tax=Chelativorans alearense TaxID=2681495 RepID=UPI001FE6E4B8|nr:ABC transporter permease [Chelativorans alearense]
MFATIKIALKDIHAGLRMRRVWIALAHEDIGDQHRRTALGPLWLLINYLAFAGTFIFVFQRGASIPNYEAYVATGLLVWFYIMETISQSVSLFVREESFIKGTTLPLSVYVMRLATQSVIRAGYAFIGCLAILVISGTSLTVMWAWSALAIVLILATAPAAIILFAFLGAYFPDSQFIVSNLTRIGMFLTPVFWAYTGGGGVRSTFYYSNPFTYFLEIVRIPILSGDVPVRSFILCGAITASLWAVALLLLGRLRKQVVFVL